MKSVRIIAGFGVVMLFVLSLIAGAEEKTGSSVNQNVKSGVAENTTAGFPTNAPVMARMNAEFMRRVMETSARIEAIKSQITERQNQIYESNPEVKGLHSQIIEMQKRINKILNEDKELIELEMKRDVLWTIMPSLPRSRSRFFPPKMMKPSVSPKK